jgi:hypothetical protein
LAAAIEKQHVIDRLDLLDGQYIGPKGGDMFRLPSESTDAAVPRDEPHSVVRDYTV